jgi:hypothetical protein
MFITRKKFKRKKGVVMFYYVLKSVKVGKKYKIKNMMYLGSVNKIMGAVKEYDKQHKFVAHENLNKKT